MFFVTHAKNSHEFALLANYCQRFAIFAWHNLWRKQDNEPMKIGQIIRQIRKEKKSTLEELAFHVGTDAANLSRIERGIQNPSPEILEKICDTFNFPISSIYLMAEQTTEPYVVNGSKEETKQTARRLENFVTKFMLISHDNQDIVNELMNAMLKAQRK